jgi:hypothetical protein
VVPSICCGHLWRQLSVLSFQDGKVGPHPPVTIHSRGNQCNKKGFESPSHRLTVEEVSPCRVVPSCDVMEGGCPLLFWKENLHWCYFYLFDEEGFPSMQTQSSNELFNYYST